MPMPPVITRTVGPIADHAGDIAPPFTGTRAAQPVASQAPQSEEMPWEAEAEEGVVEPMFEEDVSETTAQLAALSQTPPEEFPMDAFIIPEDSRSMPSGMGAKTPSVPAPEHSPINDLADTLEKLSHRLRVADANTVVKELAGGDKFESMLAGLVAGYLAASK